MNLKEISKVAKVKTKKVTIEGCDVHIRELTGKQLDQYNHLMTTTDKEGSIPDGLLSWLVEASICDEKGNLLVKTDEDKKELESWNAKFISELGKEVMNFALGVSLEELEKN